MQAGATEYLTKPVRPTELINRMREVAIGSASPIAKVLT
jgi:DNA-binding response OmpR family regulator